MENFNYKNETEKLSAKVKEYNQLDFEMAELVLEFDLFKSSSYLELKYPTKEDEVTVSSKLTEGALSALVEGKPEYRQFREKIHWLKLRIKNLDAEIKRDEMNIKFELARVANKG